ncbi:MAG TPA: hypothetical protein VEH55_07645 [Gaiellaceae bacterium]|nr:hypothetical protein [Gaiellaceae bacterium]
MRRLYAWLAGAAGGLAAYRAVRRRRPEPQPRAEQSADPRADELRARLAEAREGDGEPAGEAEPLDPEARRDLVHEQGRAVLDEMHAGE